jgi:hypothetical protein
MKNGEALPNVKRAAEPNEKMGQIARRHHVLEHDLLKAEEV